MSIRPWAAAAGATFLVALALPVAADDGGEKLLKEKGCTTCHANDRKIIGPAYKEVAKKYRGNAGAAAKLADKVIKGGAGVWGEVPMPPNRVSEVDARKLVAYVLSL